MEGMMQKLRRISEVDMSAGSPAKAIARFAVPVIIGNLFQLLYTMVDTAVVGRYVGVGALASVGATTPVVELLIGLLTGLANGVSVVIAQKIGAKREDDVRRATVNAVYLLLAMTALITGLGLAFAEPLFRLINIEESLLPGAVTYSRILFTGAIFTAVYNFEAALFRAHGNSVVPLVFLILSSVLNVGMDILFVASLNMGIAGVALATILAQAVCGALCLLYTRRHEAFFDFKGASLRPDPAQLLEHLRVGMPMAFFQSLLAVSFLVMQSALNALGAAEVAAYTAAYKMDSLTMSILSGFGTAISTFAAQNFGNRDKARILRGARDTLMITVGLSLVVLAIGQLFARPFMGLFVDASETEVIELGVRYIRFTSRLYWILGVNFVVRFVLTGVGQAVVPLGVGVLEIINRVLGTYLLIYPLGFRGMIYINPLCWATSTLLVALFFRRLLNRAFRDKKNA